MVEFTPEWIAGAREVVGNDDASPSGQIAFITLDHIERLQARVEELNERNHKLISENSTMAGKLAHYYVRVQQLEQERRWYLNEEPKSPQEEE